MAEQAPYPLFCPVAMAAELLEPRWTLLILTEMWAGSTRFSQIHRGVPGISPALLSKRLKQMEASGLIVRNPAGAGTHAEYLTTPIADRLEPVVELLGRWAHENIDSAISLRHLDAQMLMWNLRRRIDQLELPLRDCVMQFTLKQDGKEDAYYWLLIRPGMEPDLCRMNPGFNVDLFIVCELRALTSAWMGHTSFQSEIDAGRITLIGHGGLSRTMTRWLVRSCYASLSDAAPATRASAA
jgi:DNA-binding HxlR family transcriptional regulator